MNVTEIFDPQDKVIMDIPLFIRMLEWAKEDAKNDIELHNAVENALKIKQTLTMSNYSDIINV
jgi:hypothetical protein